MNRLTAAALLLLGGCIHIAPSPSLMPEIYERSTHHVNLLPELAASCIVANAKTRGYFASASPLSGMTVMSVTVRTIAAGGATLAVITLRRGESASTITASVTTPTGSFTDRKASLEQLLAGC